MCAECTHIAQVALGAGLLYLSRLIQRTRKQRQDPIPDLEGSSLDCARNAAGTSKRPIQWP